MPRITTGQAQSPDFRRERARTAARARHSVETLVATLVRRAPELNEHTRSQLRALLADSTGSVRGDG